MPVESPSVFDHTSIISRLKHIKFQQYQGYVYSKKRERNIQGFENKRK